MPHRVRVTPFDDYCLLYVGCPGFVFNASELFFCFACISDATQKACKVLLSFEDSVEFMQP